MRTEGIGPSINAQLIEEARGGSPPSHSHPQREGIPRLPRPRASHPPNLGSSTAELQTGNVGGGRRMIRGQISISIRANFERGAVLKIRL